MLYKSAAVAYSKRPKRNGAHESWLCTDIILTIFASSFCDRKLLCRPV